MEIKKPGMFQMPTDVFEGDKKNISEFISFWNKKWDWDDNQPINSHGKGMRTFLVKRKILTEDTSSNIFPGLLFNNYRKEYLDKSIKRAVNDFKVKKENIDDELLFNAFNSIQYWGSITGRTFYQRNGLNETNIIKFKVHFVKNVKPFYLSILNQISEEEINLCKIISLFENIDGIGVSFGTKHLHFWSKALGMGNPLPIYDKNIFQLLRAEIRNDRYPTWSQYLQVVEEFEKLAKKINKKPEDVEKALFAYYSKVGIKLKNKVPIYLRNDINTTSVNDFLNKRLSLK